MSNKEEVVTDLILRCRVVGVGVFFIKKHHFMGRMTNFRGQGSTFVRRET